MSRRHEFRAYPYRPSRDAGDPKGAFGLILRFAYRYVWPHKWPVLLCIILVSLNTCSVYLQSYYGRVVVDEILMVGAGGTAAASRAASELGYTRMWSIHPAQIRPILAAFAPAQGEIEQAARIVAAAAAADWAPISSAGVLHDRASYRYYWQLLERAHQTGRTLPEAVQHWFYDGSPSSFSSESP